MLRSQNKVSNPKPEILYIGANGFLSVFLCWHWEGFR